jgi:type III secretion system YscQ/HrcQ family protein
MGVQQRVEKQRFAEEARFDWAAFRAQLPFARVGQPPLLRRRVVSLGGDIMASVMLQEGRPLPEPPASPDDVETWVSFGAARGRLRVPWPLVQALVHASGFAQDCRALSAAGLSLVAEHVLAQTARPLETSLGGALRIWPDMAEGAEPEVHLTLIVALSGTSHSMALDTTAETARRLEALFPPVSPLASLPVPVQMPVPISLHSPAFRIPLSELTAFAVGDVMMLDARWTPGDAVLIAGGTHQLGDAKRDSDTGFYAFAAPDLPLPNPERTEPMSSQPQVSAKRPAATAADVHRDSVAQDQADGPIHASLEHVSIVVSIELDNAEMPLGELLKLSLGSVLPFEGEVGERVRVLANGEPFAKGELVRITGGTGVRLLSLH